MKTISLPILSIVLSLSLFARENPFEPTDHYLEQKDMIIKANELEKIKAEQEAADKIALALKEKELEAKKLAELKEQEIQQKKTQALKLMAMKEKEKIQEEAYIPEIKENFKILPYVKIYVVNNILTIKVDPQYKLLNQDILKPAKKLLFDFEGTVSIYTIRKNIISEDFKSLTVGTHMEENFFRIVIDLPEDIINYTEKIDSKNGIITIMKNN